MVADGKQKKNHGIDLEVEKQDVNMDAKADVFKDSCGELFSENKNGSGKMTKLWININGLL